MKNYPFLKEGSGQDIQEELFLGIDLELFSFSLRKNCSIHSKCSVPLSVFSTTSSSGSLCIAFLLWCLRLLLKLCLNVFLSNLSLFSYANALFARIALVYVFMHVISYCIKVRLTGLVVNQNFLQRKKSLKVIFMQNLLRLWLFKESVDKIQAWHRFGGLSDNLAWKPGCTCAVCISQVFSRLFRDVIMHTEAGQPDLCLQLLWSKTWVLVSVWSYTLL